MAPASGNVLRFAAGGPFPVVFKHQAQIAGLYPLKHPFEASDALGKLPQRRS